jgi:HTH-type transcriptional repressor of NAD biosynthesis genes
MAKKISKKKLCLIMKKGLVLGKFMPVHNGHLALVDFALEHCDELVILCCYHAGEPISGETRKFWLTSLYAIQPRVTIAMYEYDVAFLTDASNSSVEDSKSWAKVLNNLFPDLDMIFSSEPYGDIVASLLHIKHFCFDKERMRISISASAIRKHPLQYWHFLPNVVRPYFVKKISLLGSESTGKSTLAERLAVHYNTLFVPEMARQVIGHTNECTYEDLKKIANLQAKTILDKQKTANRLLFIDTDFHITGSYSVFLFQKKLTVPGWIKEASDSDIYFFLETDCAYIQDGTRVAEAERNKLGTHHKKYLAAEGVNYIPISGNWEERFKLACSIIENSFGIYA